MKKTLETFQKYQYQKRYEKKNIQFKKEPNVCEDTIQLISHRTF